MEIAYNKKVWIWIGPNEQSETKQEILIELNRLQNISDIHHPTIINSGLPDEAKQANVMRKAGPTATCPKIKNTNKNKRSDTNLY